MSGKDRDQDAPSLEPPTLFGRKRRKKDAPPAPAPAPVEHDETTRVDTPAVQADETPTTVVPPVAATPEPSAPPATSAPPAPVREPRQQPVRTHQTRTQPPLEPEPAAPPLFADEAPVLTEQEPPLWAATPAEPAATADDDRPEPTEPREPREPWQPFVTGMAAACLTGAVVGLATVASTWLGLRACEVARGTSSCGNPGFLLLIAILVAMVLTGSALLRLFRVQDPGSTSFLAVGLLTVLVLLFLIEALFSWTMVIVIPALAIGCFALAHWVTTTFVEVED
ncbi:hypothetical protein GGQ22_13540 [Nocardioides sp. zg-579]|uniref:Uncharacterized protein n=1 Tax=Nocardioides marmotae TaxID=2663857 RepID=A0A6I3JDE0_9ACTN|nr:hypothetical protein [Nocardioides marmotae]MCR6032456.1 hypothetical protein [Gordonia jinghuaiqii]MTB96105.1 hypothetical protein [Nocardioides marmotae]QKD99815.1 hypothetical protein HPC71_00935 [Nocardioides marmotae]